MAPPKRTTSGRVTPKGGAARSAASPGAASDDHGHDHDHGNRVAKSSRYTPPIPPELRESPRWVPILMIVLLALGALTILLRYIVWTDTNLPVLVGLVFMLGGLYTATKWE